MDPVQSRIRQRSSVFADFLSSLVSAVFLGLTGSFFTAFFEAGATFLFKVLGAGAALLAMTFLAAGERLAEVADVDLVDLALVFAIFLSLCDSFDLFLLNFSRHAPLIRD